MTGGASGLLLLMERHLRRLRACGGQYDGTTRHSAELERAVGDYSAFVTDTRHHEAWAELERATPPGFGDLVGELRVVSARCASLMEKYRALRLLAGDPATAGYFANVESGIEAEFGAFGLTSSSSVLLVGSGAFPMTPLLIGGRTGARVVGLDIDEEAVALGRRVVAALGPGLDIRLEREPAQESAFTAGASHVIFSSTVSVKYEILRAIHARTGDDVVVAMRYGDRFKSLFNYPREEVDSAMWTLAEQVLRPEHVFDVALYVKATRR
ncbi:hypothetical protein UO65_3845 [Actinokineospora spheciospongiae]|uniref:Nicotianamine synthase n=1 Tax=Actinokineospora spheciospongiae TaxID=909613 RepID=W7IJ80_9PSEU|nr:class I SAM-dependent methyltransferase [Actinokineospora spheciospongiae]EWC60915.1 hypothetical protein UO65_3845 [Actinokineospora spheciospongiae]